MSKQIETPDTAASITTPQPEWDRFHHVVAGISIGRKGILAPFESVLTVAATPGIVPDGVRHRHLPLSYQNMDPEHLNQAVSWVLDQVRAERTVLIRSEAGRQRPGLIAALAVLHLGGTYYDALSCLTDRHGRRILTDFRYIEMLNQAHREITQARS